jgi:hypothetical protein
LIPLSSFVKRRGSAVKNTRQPFMVTLGLGHITSRWIQLNDDYWGQAGPELPSIAACALSPRSLPVTTEYEWRRKTKWDCGLGTCGCGLPQWRGSQGKHPPAWHLRIRR